MPVGATLACLNMPIQGWVDSKELPDKQGCMQQEEKGEMQRTVMTARRRTEWKVRLTSVPMTTGS